jgi:hypothetical protein
MDPKEQWQEHCRQNEGEHCDEGIAWAEREIDRLRGEISLLQASVCDVMGERNQARSFAEDAAKKYNDLLASNRVTCVYCGHQYADGTPEAKSAALTAHIAQCEAHPMRQLGASLCTLMSLPFPPTERAIAELRTGIDLTAHLAPDATAITAVLAGLDALRVFLPNATNQGG